eukprot:14206254-Alexandrium_andersonii.AAC.1
MLSFAESCFESTPFLVPSSNRSWGGRFELDILLQVVLQLRDLYVLAGVLLASLRDGVLAPGE